MMLLSGLVAVVYAAAGPVGSAVARAYAREGAVVHLVGRHMTTLEPTVRAILETGGSGRPKPLCGPGACRRGRCIRPDRHRVQGGRQRRRAGKRSYRVVAGPCSAPRREVVTAHLHIATAVARQMTSRRSGVILAVGRRPGGDSRPPRCARRVERARRTMPPTCSGAGTGGHPCGLDPVARVSRPVIRGSFTSPGSLDDADAGQTSHGRRPSYGDVANAAVFLSSPWASTIRATEVNITGGAVVH